MSYSNLFQIADGFCTPDVSGLLYMIKTVIGIVGFVIPVVLIAYGTYDLFKAVTNGDDKEQKKARETFIRRIIYGVVIFLIPFIVQLSFSLIGRTLNVEGADNVRDDFFSCYANAKGIKISSTGGTSDSGTASGDSCNCYDSNSDAFLGVYNSKSQCASNNSGKSVTCK